MSSSSLRKFIAERQKLRFLPLAHLQPFLHLFCGFPEHPEERFPGMFLRVCCCFPSHPKFLRADQNQNRSLGDLVYQTRFSYQTNRHTSSPMSTTGVGQKRAQPSPDWTISFEDASALRLIVEAASAVMTRVMFKVVKKPNGVYFLCVDGADVGLTCCVSARLQLENVVWNDPEGDEKEFTFCVECKHVLTAVDPSAASGGLKLQGNAHDATVTFRIQDPDQPSHEDVSELSTFVDGNDGFKLTPMDFKTILEIDLAKLRDIIKKARKSHTETIRIRVFVHDEGSKKYSLVIFTVKGDNQKHDQKFCNEIHYHEDGSMVVRAAADGEVDMLDTSSIDAVFDHGFPVDKIESFVKNLPTRMVMAKIKPGLPMMLSHNLKGANDDTQHIRFLVAATNDDTDE